MLSVRKDSRPGKADKADAAALDELLNERAEGRELAEYNYMPALPGRPARL